MESVPGMLTGAVPGELRNPALARPCEMEFPEQFLQHTVVQCSAEHWRK